MSNWFKYLVKIDGTQEFRTETLKDAVSIYETALKEGILVNVYQLIMDNNGIIKGSKK